ncbi:hypothetical protein BDW22DRAFT_1427296 [Trametopsis cervina]|nr:hypothetical protein BDW22DRAFT_1427296 [Trametopsis cervina]
MPVLEIVVATPSELYRKEGTKAVEEASKIITQVEGHIFSYTGDGIQDPHQFFIAVAWNRHEDHIALMNDKQTYSAFGTALFKNISEIHLLHHAKLDDPYPALDSPVTEIVLYTLHPEADREKFVELVTELYDRASNLDGAAKGGHGPFIEDERKWVLILGFQSVEEFQRIAAVDPKVGQLIGQLKEFADATMTLVPFHKYLQ